MIHASRDDDAARERSVPRELLSHHEVTESLVLLLENARGDLDLELTLTSETTRSDFLGKCTTWEDTFPRIQRREAATLTVSRAPHEQTDP